MHDSPTPLGAAVVESAMAWWKKYRRLDRLSAVVTPEFKTFMDAVQACVKAQEHSEAVMTQNMRGFHANPPVRIADGGTDG